MSRTISRVLIAVAAASAGTGANAQNDGLSPAELRTEPPATAFRTGVHFRRALEEPVLGVSWSGTPLRGVLQQLSEAYEVAVFRDRRIDPNVSIKLTAANESLREVFTKVATLAGGEIRIIANTVYLCPPETAAIVRTVAELRREEIQRASPDRLSSERRQVLQRGHSVAWGDLTTPRQIIDEVGSWFGLLIEGTEQIPHDLWSGTALPNADASDSLTLLLMPFDLTFTWGEGFNSVRIVPLPTDRSEIAVERRYAVGGAADETIKVWNEFAGPFESRVSGRYVVVRGTLEQHEAIAAARTKPKMSNGSSTQTPDVLPLSRRQFTLAAQGVRVSSIMAKLEESGVKFEYDASALAEAGINLDHPVSLDVKQAAAADFLEAVFGPIGLRADFDGVTVRLRPAE